ncbi:hypothetical protein BAQU_1631 [Bifidobacterium aquikefiri]|uniref:Uncharacterized protein n=1 Tax=Bifidobacterium aquikefiri TaxID=1653207 RepID=A0A261G245_9BIFI|nr:hypothetical protein BAQU_1631 [Bifidobacterium aquikefiri]
MPTALEITRREAFGMTKETLGVIWNVFHLNVRKD